ncbi:MAG TPA: hypothetical protein ENK82_08735 [Campylobacterales bacterium]|nr:hypothetical protein [Campylobacterales bacterium]HHS93421.1 hypothetical protein [Campylobacterales bacterium]
MQFLDKSKELNKNPLLKRVILFLVGTLLLYLGVDTLLHNQQIGLTLTTATHTILGNEEEFLDPILFDTLLEKTHANLLSSMITIMLLATIYIRLTKYTQKRQPVIHLTFLTAILSHVALLLTQSYPLLIGIWISLFLLWHLLALYLSVIILWKLR